MRVRYHVPDGYGTLAVNPPLESWFVEDRPETYAQLVKDTCGCSARVANAIAEAYPGGRQLRDATPAALRHLGATAKQAKALVAALKLARYVQELVYERKGSEPIYGPESLRRFLAVQLAGRPREMFFVVLLDARQRVIDVVTIHEGTVNRVELHPRDVFADAIRLNAHSIIVGHNHPSGHPSPSETDVSLTERVVSVGQLLGIPVVDSVVVGHDSLTSLAELGLVSQPESQSDVG
jgi:DNA repair protein RadC